MCFICIIYSTLQIYDMFTFRHSCKLSFHCTILPFFEKKGKLLRFQLDFIELPHINSILELIQLQPFTLIIKYKSN